MFESLNGFNDGSVPGPSSYMIEIAAGTFTSKIYQFLKSYIYTSSLHVDMISEGPEKLCQWEQLPQILESIKMILEDEDNPLITDDTKV